MINITIINIFVIINDQYALVLTLQRANVTYRNCFLRFIHYNYHQRRSETKQSLIISDRSLIISDRSLSFSRYQINIFQLDFPFLLLSISQNLEFCIYDCFFWVGFPVFAVKYFSKLKFCIYDCTVGLDFPFLLLSISQNLEFCIFECPFGLDFPFLLLSISQN